MFAVLAIALLGIAGPAAAQPTTVYPSGGTLTTNLPTVACESPVEVMGTGWPANTIITITLPAGTTATSVTGAVQGGPKGMARQVTTPPTIFSTTTGYILEILSDENGAYSFTYTPNCQQIGTITFTATDGTTTVTTNVSVTNVTGGGGGGGGGGAGGGGGGGGGGSGSLPTTGSDRTEGLLRVGAVLLGAGGIAVLATQRKRRNEAPAI